MLEIRLKQHLSFFLFWLFGLILAVAGGIAVYSHITSKVIVGASKSEVVYVPNYNFSETVIGPVPYMNVEYSYSENAQGYENTKYTNKLNKLNKLLAEVEVSYTKIQSTVKSIVNKNQAKQVVKADWYISRYPKSKQEYLLKTRPKKIAWVRSFFHWYNAPLEKYAAEFVYASEYYDIDYRLLPAISIVESSGGKYLFKPYNPFGWGRTGYRSFKDAIWDVSRGLSVYYYKLDRKTPELIGELYNPVTPTEWARKVRYLMNQMPKY